MSARPFDPMATSFEPMNMDYSNQGFPGAFNVPPLPRSDDDMSEVSEAASTSVNLFPDPNVESIPMSNAENIQQAEAIPQAIPQANYRNLSTAQIKKMVPFGPILHLLDPDQQKMLLDENKTNTLDGRSALVSGVTKRFSIPSNRRRFTVTAEGNKVFW